MTDAAMRQRPARCRATGRIARLAAATIAVAVTACGPVQRPDTGPVVVSAIGTAIRPAASLRGDLDPAQRVLLDATAQGLVRFDANGQIEPGLAERWIVIDDGRSYIFRLRAARWADGRVVTATDVADLIAARLARASRNPLLPFLTAVDRVVVMTPQVIEIRLSRPRPDLLKLFAQPELALVRRPPGGGSGPLRIAHDGRDGRWLLLRPVIDPDDAPDDDAAAPRPEDDVRLTGERAAAAVARFAAGRSDLVLGGSFADWPLTAAIALPPTAVRVDPALGLFGFAVVRRDGFLADPANRAAVAQAMDRGAITAAVMPGWEPVDQLLPDGLDIAAPPQVAAWTLLTLDERRAAARAQVARWSDGPVTLRIALPAGPGATRLWGAVVASLRAVGIAAERVAIDAPADLRLIDAVAPYDNARWYLATACQPCGPAAQDRLEAARLATTLTDRATRTAEADAALNADIAYIPIARPLRWSLVSTRLAAFAVNGRARHPLNRLRADPTSTP